MHVRRVSVSYDRKFNLGDFNSISLGASIWGELEDTDDVVAAVAALQAMAREAVRVEFKRLRDGKKNSATPAQGAA
jgi:hypothetical protein